MTKFSGQTLVHTGTCAKTRRFELTFSDALGERHTLSLPTEMAAEFATVLSELDHRDHAGGPRLTKMPTRCAVGHGRYEPVVLVRFDEDPPYGLEPAEASRLGHDLRVAANALSAQKPALRQ